jgi:hypothetical protein
VARAASLAKQNRESTSSRLPFPADSLGERLLLETGDTPHSLGNLRQPSFAAFGFSIARNYIVAGSRDSSQPRARSVSFITDAMDSILSMAGHARDAALVLACCLAKQSATEMGLLDFSAQ